MPAPLSGYRILEMTSTVAGPMAGMVLADQGADIIKVESPPLGDLARYMGSARNGMAAMFATLNRNKRAVALNVKEPADREIFLKLVESADVFIENNRPGVVERLGVDYESLAAVRPDLIYASISGYGQSGPYAKRKVYDPLIQATAATSHEQSRSRPTNVRTVIFDKTSGLLTAQAVTAALLARTKSGEGAYLPISMLSSALYFSWPDTMWDHTLLDEGATNEGILADYFDVYQTRDGWVSVILVYDREFKALCEHVGHPLNEDPRFTTLPQRIRNATDLRSALDRILSEHPTESLCQFFDAHDIPCAAVNTVNSLHEDPQVVHEQLLFEIEHPVAGTMRQARPAAPFSQVEELGGPAPMLGQHNAEVLGSVGIAEADLVRVENVTRKAHETIKAMMNT
jgi:crotonobetainyl-CoA:carnitine CoA-transferase CaiB-like acyl-CoA transferase